MVGETTLAASSSSFKTWGGGGGIHLLWFGAVTPFFCRRLSFPSPWQCLTGNDKVWRLDSKEHHRHTTLNSRPSLVPHSNTKRHKNSSVFHPRHHHQLKPPRWHPGEGPHTWVLQSTDQLQTLSNSHTRTPLPLHPYQCSVLRCIKSRSRFI